MDNDERSELVQFAVGLACGMLVGAAVGLLAAPTTGANARHWIADQGRAVGRRGAALRSEAIDIVRRRGILGLADAVSRREPADS